MKLRKTLSALLVATGTAAVAAIAQADVYVYDTTAIPPHVVDVIPSDGYGYVYNEPGRYFWNGSEYVWLSNTDRLALNDDTYGRWSFVPDDYVLIPEAFPRGDEDKGG